jgi:hypothetical protein
MFIYGRSAYFEVLGNGIYVQRLVGYHVYDLPPCGVGYRLKYVSTHSFKMKPLGCKYNATFGLRL